MSTEKERLLELLTQRATDTLSEAEARELETRLAAHDGEDDTLELAAAAAWQALAEQDADAEPAPASLAAKLEADAAQFFGPGDKATVTAIDAARRPEAMDSPRLPAWSGRFGWALAASLALALLWGDGAPEAPDPAAARAELATAADAGTYVWGRPTAVGYEQVAGDVLWSSERQQGFLRLRGMPVNDPSRSQYQLWIVDPTRDAEPVDGGVFDIPSDGEVLIPIDAKLLVSSPTAFAITREQPGGVVVSEGPLLVVATTG